MDSISVFPLSSASINSHLLLMPVTVASYVTVGFITFTLSPIRKLLYKYSPAGMMMDLSPLILFLIIGFVQKLFYL